MVPWARGYLAESKTVERNQMKPREEPGLGLAVVTSDHTGAVSGMVGIA